MDDLAQQGLDFFNPGQSNFWNWADQVKTVAWPDGKTIVYRRDLHTMLNDFKEHGLPPVEAVLMILDACRDNWNLDEFCTKLNKLDVLSKISYPPVSIDQAFLNALPIQQRQWTMALDTLKLIAWLPKELRSGGYRALLLKNIFSYCPNFLTPAKEGRAYLYVFGGEIFDHWINNPDSKKADMRARVLRSLEALSHFPYEVDLEALMRTGVERTPPPLPLPEPEPIPQSDDLMTQLANDPQTAGLARLTKHLIAALNIPPHTQGASDQPFGGVSDISNSGDYDRLLLSELANDDDTLSARLVNNEALYLRRETPPDPQVQERVILVDTSLRLWGTPRVFAVAAALGCALNNPHKAKVTAFALGQETSAPNALSSKEEVLHFLEKISPVLHPGEALRPFFQQNAVSRQQSLFLITSEEVMADQEFARMLAEFRHRLDYLLVLSRSGELHTYKVGNGRKSLINTSTFDLPRFLLDHKKPDGIARLIEVLELKNESFQPKNALLLPTFPGRVRRHEVAYNQHLLVAVLPSRKVWLWHSAEKGAIEILPAIEQGDYRFYLEKDELQCLIVYAPNNLIKAYLFKHNQLQREVDFTKKITKYAPHWMVIPLPEFPGTIHTCGFKEGNLLVGIIGSNGYRGYPQAATHVLDLAINALLVLPGVQSLSRNTTRLSLSTIKPIINNGYSVLRNIRSIGVTNEGNLQLDQFQIVLNTELWLEKKSNDLILYKDLIYEPMLNTHFYTRSAKWANGCKVVVDSHGFIHFYYPGSSKVAFSLTLIIGKELAAYIGNDTFTGNPYFYTTSPESIISPGQFYQSYLKVFIDKMQENL